MAKKNSGVLTRKEMENKGEGGQPPSPSSPPQPAAPVAFIYQAKLPHAPLGESCTTITYEGELIRIVMHDGIYKFPENMKRGEEAFMEHLKRHEFVDASFIDAASMQKQEPEVPKKYLYIVGHPENTKETKVTGSFMIEGYEKPFECVDGVIKTRDKEEFEDLMSKGFYQVAITEIKDEDDGKDE
jgi:hypothetical protein